MHSRLATQQDFEGILRLAQGKVYPNWPWEDPAQSGVGLLQSLRASDSWTCDFDLLISEEDATPTGFLLLEKHKVNSVTDDRDSLLRDLFATSDSGQAELVRMASNLARGYGSGFLTTEVATADNACREMLRSLGFALESHLVAVASGTPGLPENSPYSVRRSTPDDAFAISILNSTVLGNTLSAEREYDLSDLMLRSMGATMARVARQDAGSVGLVLTQDEEMAGYLLLEVNERFGYVSDVAVEPAHRGGTAVRHLVLSGSRLLHEKGIPWYIGDISAANARALGSALRGCGFEAVSERYGMKL